MMTDKFKLTGDIISSVLKSKCAQPYGWLDIDVLSSYLVNRVLIGSYIEQEHKESSMWKEIEDEVNSLSSTIKEIMIDAGISNYLAKSGNKINIDDKGVFSISLRGRDDE